MNEDSDLETWQAAEPNREGPGKGLSSLRIYHEGRLLFFRGNQQNVGALEPAGCHGLLSVILFPSSFFRKMVHRGQVAGV